MLQPAKRLAQGGLWVSRAGVHVAVTHSHTHTHTHIDTPAKGCTARDVPITISKSHVLKSDLEVSTRVGKTNMTPVPFCLIFLRHSFRQYCSFTHITLAPLTNSLIHHHLRSKLVEAHRQILSEKDDIRLHQSITHLASRNIVSHDRSLIRLQPSQVDRECHRISTR